MTAPSGGTVSHLPAMEISSVRIYKYLSLAILEQMTNFSMKKKSEGLIKSRHLFFFVSFSLSFLTLMNHSYTHIIMSAKLSKLKTKVTPILPLKTHILWNNEGGAILC